jgi:hypothetical protein
MTMTIGRPHMSIIMKRGTIIHMNMIMNINTVLSNTSILMNIHIHTAIVTSMMANPTLIRTSMMKISIRISMLIMVIRKTTLMLMSTVQSCGPMSKA